MVSVKAEEAHYLLAAVWLVRNTRSVFGLIPDVIGGLFSS